VSTEAKTTEHAASDLATFRDEFPASDLDEPWFTTAFEMTGLDDWNAYWANVQRLDAEAEATRYFVVGPQWGSEGDWTREQDEGWCEVATDWCTEHEGDSVSITFLAAHRSTDAAGTYRVSDTGRQILGYSIACPEEIDSLINRAMAHALGLDE